MTQRTKRLPLFGLLAVLLTTTGCFDILERVLLRKDGSGEYTLQIDMSGAFELMQAMGDEELDLDFSEPIDSVMRFADMPDSIRSAWKHPEIMHRAALRVVGDPYNSKLMLEMRLDFDDVADITRFQQDLAESDGGVMGMPLSAGEAPERAFFFRKGMLERSQRAGAGFADVLRFRGRDGIPQE